jgi:hypothetical protein
MGAELNPSRMFGAALCTSHSTILAFHDGVYGGAPWVSTSAIKARNSSRPGKRVARPDTTCSMRPCSPSGVSAVPSRNCTTKTQWGDRGGSGIEQVSLSASCGVRGWYVGYMPYWRRNACVTVRSVPVPRMPWCVRQGKYSKWLTR